LKTQDAETTESNVLNYILMSGVWFHFVSFLFIC